jgi:hypothetical protein
MFELEKEVSHLKNDNLLLHRMVKNLTRELNSVKGQNNAILAKLKVLGIKMN